jgi:hypothetical protein
MKVFLLGLAHGIQTTGGNCSATQKAEYRMFLSEVIAQRCVTLVAEEESPGNTTIASDLAQSLGIRWEPIDMNGSDKEKLGVPKKGGTEPKYLADQACTELTEEGFQRDLGNGWVEIERRDPADEARDEFMFHRVISAACNSKSILVLCGYNHLKQMEQKFCETGHDVGWDALYKHTRFGL